MDPAHPSQPPRPPTYTLDIFTDPQFAKEIVKAVLHTIFFHRYFSPIIPLSRDLLDLTLPAIDDVDLETLIEQRADSLVQELGSGLGSGNGADTRGMRGMGGVAGASRGQLVCQFYEKRRRKAYFSFGKDDEVCWEQWLLDITLATPRTETDSIKVRRAMEKSLQNNVMKILDLVNRHKAHIPPILTSDNPFPYHILINPRNDGWNQKMGIF